MKKEIAQMDAKKKIMEDRAKNLQLLHQQTVEKFKDQF